MHGALKKYATLENPDDQVKEWISLVRELAYDTEDCFDNFIHHLDSGERHDGGFKEFFRKTARRLKTLGARRGIANQIYDLKLRIKEAKELKTSYKLDDIACNTSAQAVEDSKHHLKVFSIVGFGGLGKTTLANQVYRKIRGQFQCHAFVSVSQKPDTKKIIKDVISQVSFEDDEFTKDMENWDETKSIAKLRELLQDKRYLVIIDDIWSILAWNSIKCAFPENKFSSRIITTTRICEVASSCCQGGDDQIYKMTPLSNTHSEKLFFNRIFGPEDCCPDMLRQVSSAILKKCGGLPLAIISISGLLANRPRVKEEWEKVKRSIGYDLNKSQSIEGMKNILSLSYNDLPPNLKTCLLHLSNFPEDYVIERGRLLMLWMAEGFISEEHGLSRHEVADKYFYELINKSMVQPVDISYDGVVRACRVHDMMLELIISKSIEENFVTVVSGRQTVWENSQCFIRRLSVQQIDHQIASELARKDLKHVRSLIVTSSSCIKHLPSLDKFESLRVLDFQGCTGLEEFDMNGMKKLFHLKHLSFRGTCISELPSGIVMLHDLETLDLRDTNIQELPAGIVQLTKIKILFVTSYSKEIEIPVGIGKMTNLEGIYDFNITSSTVGAVEELGNLINLRIIHVRYIVKREESHKYIRHAEMLVSSLRKLNLVSLCMNGGNSSLFELLDSWYPSPSRLLRFELHGSYFLSKLPKWIVPELRSLLFLTINLTEVTQEDLRILGELPALLSLRFYCNPGQKGRLLVQGRGFSCLKEFEYYPYHGVTFINLLFEEGALPKVEKLYLPFFPSMTKGYGFYIGIEHLPYLKHATFYLHDKGATSSERKAAEAAIRKEARLHPNRPRLNLYGSIGESSTDDEVSEEHRGSDEEI
uniref:Uncharacterized protein n=1 Tax=Avena sativa TaxID=4498 RepID=A0ACD5W752_AVESA